MKKKFKRILSVILCLVILCCPFANVIQPAYANPAAIWASAEALEAVSWVLGLLGITFASKGAMAEASNEYLTKNPTISNDLNNLMTPLIMNPNGVPTFNANNSILTYFKDTLIPSVSAFFSRKAVAIQIDNKLTGTASSIKYTTKMTFESDLEAYSYTRYSYNLATESVPISFTINGVLQSFYIKSNNNTPDWYMGLYSQNNTANRTFVCISDDITNQYLQTPAKSSLPNFNHFEDIRFGFRLSLVNSVAYMYPYLAWAYTDNSNVTHYGSYVVANPSKTIQMSPSVIVPDTAPLTYTYDMDYSYPELISAIQLLIDKISAGVGSLDLPWQQPREDVEEGKQEVENEVEGKPYVPEWAYWWEKLGIKDLIDTLTQSKTITESDVKMPELPVSIKDKFPFCVPFDVYYMIEKLNATSVAPSWNIPFKIQSLGINQNIPLDLSGWESVAAVCRWANVLLFILALVLLTRNIIRA